ncbi:hypothetical protein B0H19DRAFT_1078816 [Mycena capillaripes]|nr:hypothetical protein B0H19DRAFT_1078816 [Mycena capillaripes]
MLTARYSASADLSGRGRMKRKAEEMVFDMPRTSRLFTEARPFQNELFQTEIERIELYEDSENANKRGLAPENSDYSMAPPDIYHRAAAELQDNVLWKSVREHIVVENETSCRTAIDLILLTAINLAQQQIATKKDVDDTLRTRHCIHGNGDSSWTLLPTVAFHGSLDYLIGVVSGKNAQDVLKHSTQAAAAAASTSSGSTKGSGNRRSTRLASCSKKPSLSTVAETPGGPPFKSATTRFLNILKDGHLAIILRLLTLTIFSSLEEFVQLAASAA